MTPAQAEKQFNAFAVIGLIAAICGLPLEYFPWKPAAWGNASFGLFFAICSTLGGIVASHAALAEITQSPEQYKGRVLAFAGLAVGYLSIAAFIVAALLF